MMYDGTLVKVIDESGDVIQDVGGSIGWFNSIGSFEPGEGYYIKVNSDVTLSFDDGDQMAGRNDDGRGASDCSDHFITILTPRNMFTRTGCFYIYFFFFF